MRVDYGFPPSVHLCVLYLLRIFWGRALRSPTKLRERTRYAPVLRRVAFLEGSLVDFEVRLSSIVAVEFRMPDI